MRHAIRRAVPALLLLLLAGSAAPSLAQVSGHCFLADQSDHSGVSVVFTAGSPSAVSDSTLTDGDGAYALTLAVGIYTVEYRKAGYLPQALPDAIFVGVDPVALGDVTLDPGALIEISGDTGTVRWTSGTTVRVVGHVFVAQYDTLTIEPGVRVLFAGDGYYSLSVFGTAFFLGAEGDSIVFESELPEAGPNAYDKVSFNGCAGGRADYCVFRHAGSVQAGGWCQNPQRLMEFNHCAFEWTFFGVAMGRGPATLNDCLMRRNSSHGAYLAACDSLSVLNRCRFVDNTGSSQILVQDSAGWPRFTDCEITGEEFAQPSTYGLDARGSSVIFRGGRISGGRVAGAALDLGTGRTAIQDCLITGNADGIAAGFVLATLSNNTIVGNTGNGLALTGGGTGGGPRIFNNIISGNGTGLLLDSAVDRLEYNDIHGNGTDAAGTALPLAFGTPITVNANGDPADIYFNIAEDPLFVDAAGGDYHLQAESPCLDAGDPALLDPDGTVGDLGCFWRDQVTGAPAPPAALRLLPCAPNPFNPRTEVRFVLERPETVVLTIHDAAGRRVRELFRGALPAGPAALAWDGRDDAGRSLPSGVYFSRLSGRSGTRTGKMALVR